LIATAFILRHDRLVMRVLLLLLPALLTWGSAQAAQIDFFPPVPGITDGRARLLPLVTAEARRLGVPPDLADAVATIETGHTETAQGSSGEIGLMQVMPSTAWMLGFRGTSNDLFAPATNIHYGVTYLARALAASGGNLCRALMKYRAGVGEEGYSPLSIQYCRRAGAALRAQNSPLAQQVAAATPDAPDIADAHQVSVYGGHFHPDMAAFAAIADIPGLVVEPAIRGWHLSGGRMVAIKDAAPKRASPRVQAIMEILRDDEAGDDPHVVHIPGG
jgi:hypothetical protein